MVVYMQMGGGKDEPSAVQRARGAREAARTTGVELVEQYAGWDPRVMVQQLKKAVDARPDGIVIMGHAGDASIADLVRKAENMGVVVTAADTSLVRLRTLYRNKGFGHVGPNRYQGGHDVGKAMLAAGLKRGDRALVYAVFSDPNRAQAPKGMVKALSEAGVAVERLELALAVEARPETCIAELVAYMKLHPATRAIGTLNGGVTRYLPRVVKALGKRPGEVVCAGVDLCPMTVEGLRQGYIAATLDQRVFLQGFFPVLQITLTKGLGAAGFDVDTGARIVTRENVGEAMCASDSEAR